MKPSRNMRRRSGSIELLHGALQLRRGAAWRGQIAEASAHFERAFALKPDFLEGIALCMAQLPALYEQNPRSPSGATLCSRLARLRRMWNTRCTAALTDAIAPPAFYLPYQGFDDRELQTRYGSLVCKIMAADTRQLFCQTSRFARTDQAGIVSGFFRQHSNWRIPIKDGHAARPESFHVSGYYTSGERDRETDAAAALCDRFVQGPRSLDAWRRMILDDAPHVLIFPEIGHGQAVGATRGPGLAAVQCAPGASVTAGFRPSITSSAAISWNPLSSSALFERLLRCRNFRSITNPADISLSRSTGRNSACAIAPWSIGAVSHCKYLPQFDDVSHALQPRFRLSVIFIEFAGAGHHEMFRARLDRAFKAVGLSAQITRVSAELVPDRFVAAIGQCDVVLDSIGCQVAIRSGKPGSQPSDRDPGRADDAGRHTAAILDMMDVREGTARTVDEYVATASFLGVKSWRIAFSPRSREKASHLCDRDCIAAGNLLTEPLKYRCA